MSWPRQSWRPARECVHGDPGGSDRCALCRREIAAMTADVAAPGPRRRPQAEGVPMPDYVRQLLIDLGLRPAVSDGEQNGPSTNHTAWEQQR